MGRKTKIDDGKYCAISISNYHIFNNIKNRSICHELFPNAEEGVIHRFLCSYGEENDIRRTLPLWIPFSHIFLYPRRIIYIWHNESSKLKKSEQHVNIGSIMLKAN